MAVDLARVAMVFAAGAAGSRVGSGYSIGVGTVLTAAHVLSEAGLGVGDRAEVCLLGSGAWVTGSVTWSNADLDVAVLHSNETLPWREDAMSPLRWGRLVGAEPVMAAAIGFPWAQERPDQVRDTEHVVGFIPPGAGVETERLHLTVLTAAPIPHPATGSPWAGMSGAALVVGSYLVGMVTADPARYGTDRLVAVPVATFLAAPGFSDVLGERPMLVPVGAAWRLEYAEGRSLTLAAPYRPLPANFDVTAARARLLYPEHGVVPFSGRGELVTGLAAWCTDGGAGLAVRTVTGAGGSGKTRLAAEACLAVAGRGWEAGFADLDRPGGAVRWQLERPTLLVVDDADLSVSLAADLVNSLAYADVPTRLLLLARSRAPWWQQLMTATDSLVNGFDSGDLSLGAHRLDETARVAHYQAACTALARALEADARPGIAPAEANLAEDAFGDPLMVHVAALLAVSGEPLVQVDQSATLLRSVVLRALLDREAERWRRQLRGQELLEESATVLRQCVAAATISCPQAVASAAAILTAVPDLGREAEAGRRRALARWLHQLNPGVDYWNPLRPDPLADQLLADLESLPELIDGVAETALASGDLPTLDRMLAELIQAATASDGLASTALGDLLRQRLQVLLDVIVASRVDPMQQRLARAVVTAATAMHDDSPSLAGLDRLIGALETLVAVTPLDGSSHGIAVMELAETLGNRWGQTRDEATWDRGRRLVKAWKKRVSPPDWRAPLYVLAEGLLCYQRAMATSNVADINQAINALEAARDGVRQGSGVHGTSSALLSELHLQLYQAKQRPVDLDASIGAAFAVLASDRARDDERYIAAQTASRALRLRYDRTHRQEDLDTASLAEQIAKRTAGSVRHATAGRSTAPAAAPRTAGPPR